MLRVYIWNPVGTMIDPAAWGDMVLDGGEAVLEGGREVLEELRGDDALTRVASRLREPRVLPDLYDEHMSPRWGHAGMGFRDVMVDGHPIVAYRAFWPHDPTNWPLLLAEPGTIYTSLETDIASEGGSANHVVTLPSNWPLDEAGVWAQWEQWRASPPGYAAMGFNCCASVARSIALNMDTSGLSLEAQYLLAQPEPDTPPTLRTWLRQLESLIR